MNQLTINMMHQHEEAKKAIEKLYQKIVNEIEEMKKDVYGMPPEHFDDYFQSCYNVLKQPTTVLPKYIEQERANINTTLKVDDFQQLEVVVKESKELKQKISKLKKSYANEALFHNLNTCNMKFRVVDDLSDLLD